MLKKQQPDFNRRIHLIVLFVLFFVVAGLIFGLSSGSFFVPTQTISKEILVHSTMPRSMVDELKNTFSEKQIVHYPRWGLECFLNTKNIEAIVLYNIQALPLVQNSTNLYWYPLGETAAVFAVDQSQTNISLVGWNDLELLSVPFAMTDLLPEGGMLLYSMSYGLNKQMYQPRAAVNVLQTQYQKEKFFFSDENAPVQILLDYQAQAKKEQGQDIKVVYPAEGGLIFELGLLSKVPLTELLSLPTGNEKAEIKQEEILQNLRAEFGRLPLSEEGRSEKNKRLTLEEIKELNNSLLLARLHIDRGIYRTHIYTTASAPEHNLAVVFPILIFILWVLYSRYRTMQQSVKVAITLIGISMICWSMVRFIKWQLPMYSTFSRYLWYSFYPFMFLMAAAFLWLALAVGKSEDNGRPPYLWWGLILLQNLLLVLVYTNDLHQMVFRFDLKSNTWAIVYHYGPGFILVYLAYMIPLVSGLIILGIKCWKSPKKIWIAITILLFILMLAYWLMYLLRIPEVFNGDITIMTCLFVLIISESAMNGGLIPRNRKYKKLFYHMASDIQIVDFEGNTVIASQNAVHLTEFHRERLYQKTLSGILERNDHYLLFAEPITGGTVVWKEDISRLRKLRQEIQQAREKQEETNRLLKREQEIKEIIESTRAKEKINIRLEEEIGGFLEEIQHLAEDISEDKEQQALAEIHLLFSYVKRRCYLLFSVENSGLPEKALVLYIKELLNAVEYSKIKYSEDLRIGGEIPLSSSILLYDLLFYALRFLMKHKKDVILRIERIKEHLELTLIASLDWQKLVLPKPWQEHLKKEKGSLSYKELEGATSLIIFLPITDGRGGREKQ